MRNRNEVLRIFAACLVAVVTRDVAAQGGDVNKAAWLAGCWELRAANRVTTEMWMAPAGGSMFGVSRTTVGGAVREFEFLRLFARGDSLVYHAIPSGQTPTDFAGSAPNDSTLDFANPAHDFPKRVMYRRVGADSLVASIEGPGRDGATRRINFPMRRVSCVETPR